MRLRTVTITQSPTESTQYIPNKDVVKCLKCCRQAPLKDCKNCPYHDEEFCSTTLLIDTIEFISKLQEEKNTLKRQVNRLKNYDERRDIALHSRLIANARTEAIKECLNKIEQTDVSESDDYIMIKKNRFDNLVKELVGEE